MKIHEPEGRPPKFKSVEELQTKIDNYFDHCDKKNKPYTITGMAVFLDTSRETLLAYRGKPKFSDTIKSAKRRVEAYAEEQLYKGKNVAGVIFSMVNNFSEWKNTQRSEITGANGKDLKVEVVDYSKADKQE